MKKWITVGCLSLIAVSPLLFALPQEKTGIEGIWLGTLEAMGTKLRLAFHISRGDDGSLKATMDSLDQGATGIPVDSMTFQEGKLNLEIKALLVVYKAELNEESTELTGTFTQAGMSYPLKLTKTDKVPEIIRPQDPKKPYPYVEEEVAYENTEAGIKLAGTLTYPKEGAPFPAVILITGSGAQNRNEEIYGHRPFLVLADHLTRNGLAVLRVDDRGVGGSTGDLGESTSMDLATDVLSGLAFLKGREEIDPKKIGLVGHSEGGLIAPIVASQSGDVTFIVLMAGTGLTGEEILYLQAELISRASGATEEKIAEGRAEQERIFSVLKKDKPVSDLKEELQDMFIEDLKTMTDEEKAKLGDDPEMVFESQAKQVLSKWFRYFLTYDPKTALREVKCPVLALNGEKDLQVPSKENLAAIESALKDAGNTNFTIKEMPGLNHLFQKAKTGNLDEYAQSPITIDPGALQTISNWILKTINLD